jgi:hypothetical protein
VETDNQIEYSCCFCNDTVSSTERSHALDPCALVLVGHIDQDYEDRKEQEFYCHFECFSRLVKAKGLMYIAESYFATIGEIAAEREEEKLEED